MLNLNFDHWNRLFRSFLIEHTYYSICIILSLSGSGLVTVYKAEMSRSTDSSVPG